MEFLTAIERGHLRRGVAPGDQIVPQANVLKFGENTYRAKAVAKIGGTVAAEAEMQFGIMKDSR